MLYALYYNRLFESKKQHNETINENVSIPEENQIDREIKDNNQETVNKLFNLITGMYTFVVNKMLIGFINIFKKRIVFEFYPNLEDVFNNPDDYWDFHHLSRHPDLTLTFVKTFADKPWDWSYLENRFNVVNLKYNLIHQ